MPVETLDELLEQRTIVMQLEKTQALASQLLMVLGDTPNPHLRRAAMAMALAQHCIIETLEGEPVPGALDIDMVEVNKELLDVLQLAGAILRNIKIEVRRVQ